MKTNSSTLLILLCAIAISVTGEFFLKHGMNKLGEFNIRLQTLPGDLLRIFSTPAILIGFFFVFSGAIVWLSAISRVPLSWAYPMLSLGYVFVALTSSLFLGEAFSWQRLVGSGVIVSGVYLIFRT